VLLPEIPPHIAGHEFSKFVRGFFRQGSTWSFAKGPITQTFLKLRPGINEEEVRAVVWCGVSVEWVGGWMDGWGPPMNEEVCEWVGWW
jgi:hypothetical protein